MNKMVVPAPSSLSAQIRPPCRSTMPRLIARPRPVPPFWRASEESTCSKRSKTRLELVGGDAATVVAHPEQHVVVALGWRP